jgi:hypothetical protein
MPPGSRAISQAHSDRNSTRARSSSRKWRRHFAAPRSASSRRSGTPTTWSMARGAAGRQPRRHPGRERRFEGSGVPARLPKRRDRLAHRIGGSRMIGRDRKPGDAESPRRRLNKPAQRGRRPYRHRQGEPALRRSGRVETSMTAPVASGWSVSPAGASLEAPVTSRVSRCLPPEAQTAEVRWSHRPRLRHRRNAELVGAARAERQPARCAPLTPFGYEP